MIMNAMHTRQVENDHENVDNIRGHRHIGDNVRDHEGWFRNSRIILLYFFATFVIIRIWILVVATENKVYIVVTAVAMGSATMFYLRWRRRYVMLLREDFARRQRDRDVVTIEEFLARQAAMRAALTGETVVSAGSLLPHNMPMLIAALPVIVYQPANEHRPVRPSSVGSLFGTSSKSGSNSNKVVPVRADSPSDIQLDLESGEREAEQELDQVPLCMICLGNFQTGDILTSLPCVCGHQYHRTCLIAWLERKTTCPLCAQSVAGMLLGNQGAPPEVLVVPDPVIRPFPTMAAFPGALTGNGTGNGNTIGDAAEGMTVVSVGADGMPDRDRALLIPVASAVPPPIDRSLDFHHSTTL
jgi:Ring finger domain